MKDWKSTRSTKYNKYTRAEVSFLKKKEQSSRTSKNIYLLYNEELDPGSGWTLAAGLTHASRGAACLAIGDGDRRMGA